MSKLNLEHLKCTNIKKLFNSKNNKIEKFFRLKYIRFKKTYFTEYKKTNVLFFSALNFIKEKEIKIIKII